MNDKNKKLPIILIGGGVMLIFIIAAGVYLSQNPQIISKWQYQRDSARKEKMQLILLKSPESCKNQRLELFVSACAHLDDASSWYKQLAAGEQTCLMESYRVTTEFRLKFDGDPASNIENMLRDDSIVLHACGVGDDSNHYLKDKSGSDAETYLNNWYQWKYDEGNYFN